MARNKVKARTGKGFPHRDQGEGPSNQMPKRVTSKALNKKSVAGRSGKPMPRTTSGSTFKKTPTA